MSIELSLTIKCAACGHTSWASEEDHGRGRLTFVACDRCKELSAEVVDDNSEAPPTRCACGGTRTEWDDKTCPRCGAAAKGEWFQTWN